MWTISSKEKRPVGLTSHRGAFVLGTGRLEVGQVWWDSEGVKPLHWRPVGYRGRLWLSNNPLYPWGRELLIYTCSSLRCRSVGSQERLCAAKGLYSWTHAGVHSFIQFTPPLRASLGFWASGCSLRDQEMMRLSSVASGLGTHVERGPLVPVLLKMLRHLSQAVIRTIRTWLVLLLSFCGWHLASQWSRSGFPDALSKCSLSALCIPRSIWDA